MKPYKEQLIIHDIPVNVYAYNTVIVGSGAAGLNAAASLYKLGQKDIALITDGMNRGTSRNTGSDKQTYYKQSTSIKDADSPLKMAQTLFNGGAMHGDIALVEAALSLKSFYNLVEIGVPFPHDTFGQYVGYKTDHDENSRASSVGPLTSKLMTEKLEDQVKNNGTDIFDSFMVIGILKEKNKDEAIGILALDVKRINEQNYGLTLFNCRNIIYGTGGPASIYYRSVYPKSQSGATGIALEAGARANNLTEWQYGIASTKFRWNLSGTYQQVIPRYISTDENMGDEREFLEDYFKNPTELLNAVFLKGYQWPFDAKKLRNNGSSIVDLLIYIETQIKGRRVFMDFLRNPSCADVDGSLDFQQLGEEAYGYLKNSDALLPTPIARLKKMNPLAIDLYRDNNIDLEKEWLEIDVCAQHQNGGLVGNVWWESNIKHFFPVGEVNGTLGIYRPGGTALNSTQVGSYRAAEYIKNQYADPPIPMSAFKENVIPDVEKRVAFIKAIKIDREKPSNVLSFQQELQKKMSKAGAFIRNKRSILETLEEFKKTYSTLHQCIHIKDIKELPAVFRVYDMLITQIACLSAMLEYIEQHGDSRGSYLIADDHGSHEIKGADMTFKFSIERDSKDRICETYIEKGQGGIGFDNTWVDVRPIPEYDSWFENVWSDFRENKIFKK
ncbi:FAD-binding protein [Geosporobacter ferrireducens]|uniref:Oxidoreductase n=1 Tax=Geosporobacter ferrireducens TaxID=1424294 RepID=A0A1D8GLU9_9FIRM|nr:FAD-binding protein [Geosporobacter ferrireducens]AOT71890.1 oxidoreductase [Geosporobacter ferrireducens]MTI55680.1 FAD-binding protein [Geosporobacter ferrireducens]